MSSMTVGERIVLHLSQYSRHRENFQCPPEVTQKGISEKLGISRAHAAIELKRLKDMGEVEERVAHVTKAKTRRKVYFLNLRGENRAREMKEYARQKKVKMVDSSGELEVVDGRMAIDVLRSELNLDEAKAYEVVITSNEIDPADFAMRPLVQPAEREEENFFGREGEIKYFLDWLGGIGPRIMVVLGIPGIGKTRLAARMVREFDGPHYYHSVKEWDTPELVLGSISAFLEGQGRKALKGKLGSILDWDEISRILKRDLRGCLMVFDDIHKSRKMETFLGLFKEMEGFKGWVVATSRQRPYFYDSSDTLLRRKIEELRLEGLNREATREVILRSKRGYSEEAIKAIYDITKGHPLYIEFMLARGDKKAKTEFESYLHDQILSSLSMEEEGVLRMLCVHRYPVTKDAVQGVSPVVLKKLTRLLLLSEEGGTFSVEPTVGQIFHAKMDQKQRKEAHSRAADYHLKMKDHFERLFHLVEAGRYPEAARLCLKMGEEVRESDKRGKVLNYIRFLEPKVRYAKKLRELAMKIGGSESRGGVKND